MNAFEIGENSIKIAKGHRDTLLNIEELSQYDGLITKVCRKYLISKICERGKNDRNSEERVIDIYARCGPEVGYRPASVKSLITYACAIDHLYKIAPDIADIILSGKIKLSHKHIIALAKMRLSDIRMVIDRLASEKTLASVIFKEQKEHPKIKEKRGRPKGYSPALLPRTSVKDIPSYDPDSQVMALSLTIPSWVSTVDKTFMNADFSKISLMARTKLKNELLELKNITDEMIVLLLEEQ